MMSRINKETSELIRSMWQEGWQAEDITKHLEDMGVTASVRTVQWHCRKTPTKRSRTPFSEVKEAVDEILKEGLGLPAREVQQLLEWRYGITIGLFTLAKAQRELGWKNKFIKIGTTEELRLQQAQDWKAVGEKFDNVFFTDKTTVVLERLRLPLEVHVWAGISHQGPGPLLIFGGDMDRHFYEKEMIRKVAGPYLRDSFLMPTHRFFQDNNPIHTAPNVRVSFEQEGINWVKTPPESPDLNPMSLVWSALKDYVRLEAKPCNKKQLFDAISRFWSTKLTGEDCNVYIDRLDKVILQIIALNGGPTGM